MAKIAHENRVFGAAVVTAINKSSARGPVESEHSIGVANRRAVKLKCLLSSFGARELDETVSGTSAFVLETTRLVMESRNQICRVRRQQLGTLRMIGLEEGGKRHAGDFRTRSDDHV